MEKQEVALIMQTDEERWGTLPTADHKHKLIQIMKLNVFKTDRLNSGLRADTAPIGPGATNNQTFSCDMFLTE